MRTRMHYPLPYVALSLSPFLSLSLCLILVFYAFSVGVPDLFPSPPFLFDLIAPFYAPRARIYVRLRSAISHTGLMLMHARIRATA